MKTSKSKFHENRITILAFVLTIFSNILCAQTSPPLGERGMYVRCMNEVIWDIHIGNPSNYADKLLDYAKDNNFTYLALFGIDHNSDPNFPNGYIMGDPNFEPDLFTFISNAHDRGIKIGIVVSEKSFIEDNFLTPHYTWQNAPVRIDCYPDQARLMVNPKSDASLREHLKAEICKVALRTAAYNSQSIFAGGYADFVSLEYEYWTSKFYADHPQYIDMGGDSKELWAYRDLLDILNFMRYVICSTR